MLGCILSADIQVVVSSNCLGIQQLFILIVSPIISLWLSLSP
jgi:hypothetical protein